MGRLSHLQKLLWVQVDRAVHHDQVDHPGQEDQVVQGSQCHPCHPSHH